MKNTKNKLQKQKSVVESKDQKTPSKFGVLGKDLSSKFSSGGNRAWRPTKPGGRNGQGKP